MNRSFYMAIASMFLFLGFSAEAPFADERLKIIEMADCNTVSFPMAKEEIAAEDATNAKLEPRHAREFAKPSIKFATFEMGESGHTISFPLNREDIAMVKAEYDRIKKYRTANDSKSEIAYEQVELPESGIAISFRSNETPDLRPTSIDTASSSR